MNFWYILVSYFGLMAVANAQIQPKQPLDKAMIQKAIDSTSVGAQAVLNFEFKEEEIQGFVYTSEQRKAENAIKRKAAEELLKQKPDNLDAYLTLYTLAVDTATQNQYKKKCFELLNQQIEANPTSGENYFQKGKLFQSEFKFEEAYAQYVEAQKYMPDSSKVYQKAGELFFLSLRYSQSKEYFIEAIKKDVGNLSAQMFYSMTDMFTSMMSLAEAEQKGIKLEEAMQNMQQDLIFVNTAIEKYPNRIVLKDFKEYMRLFWIFYKGFMIGSPLLNEEKNQALFSKGTFKIGQLFAINFQEKEDLKKLTVYFQKLIADKRLQNPSLAYEALGMIAVIQNESKKAMQYFEKVSKLNIEKGQNYDNMAFVYLFEKNYKKAENAMLRKIKYANNPSAYHLLASIYERQKKYEEAKKTCIEGNLKHSNSDIKGMLGMLEARAGNHAQAQIYLEESIKLKATAPHFVYGLALTYFAQQNWEEGYKCLKDAAEQGNKEAGILLAKYF